MQAWADRKSAATGKKWTVGLTGAEITESNVKEVVSPMSFNDDDWYEINTETKTLAQYQDVYKIQTTSAQATYTYSWRDPDYCEQQIKELK